MADEYQGPADSFAKYRAVVDAHPDAELKGAKNPYTSLNGHMTSFLDADGSMGLRLSSADRDEFIAAYDTAIAEQYGRKMKEFVVVPDSLLDDPDALGPWFARSREWVATLKPKPTTKKK